MPVKFTVRTTMRNQFVDITDKVREAVRKSGVKSGIAVVYVPHTTAGITINEGADPAVRVDIINWLNEYVPEDRHYRHLEGNSDSHIKASLVGSSVNLIIENGDIVLGTWQSIFFCEFDGPRTRTVLLKIVPD